MDRTSDNVHPLNQGQATVPRFSVNMTTNRLGWSPAPGSSRDHPKSGTRGFGEGLSEDRNQQTRIEVKNMAWLINDWYEKNHRGIDAAPEGGCKTTFGAWMSICIAAGVDFLGQPVQQGPVLLVDEETPFASLERMLDRFSNGLGYGSYKDLPITVVSFSGFRFKRKAELDKLLTVINKEKPVFIRLDSYVAMLPGSRQGLSENNSEAGIAVRDDLNNMLAVSPGCNILLAAHSPKPVIAYTLDQIRCAEMPSLVRGHGSLVGEACDTGFAIKKLSQYPDPLRFGIITNARRGPNPMSAEVVYVEMKEERYGEGWARLESIPPVPCPPSKAAKELFHYFLDQAPHQEQDIRKINALRTTKEIRSAIDELLDANVIVNHQRPFTYELNSNYQQEVDAEYLGKLT
ncbi:MAG: AAA family ATPase [Planctomycetes bacterium]|nr:AAA family ATPase [Planctomycetota bacterium]